MARVFIPFAMRKLTGGVTDVRVPGENLREVIDNLEEMFPGTRERILVDGALRAGMAAVVGEQPTREGLRAKVGEDTEVHFIPAIAGGQAGRAGTRRHGEPAPTLRYIKDER